MTGYLASDNNMTAIDKDRYKYFKVTRSRFHTYKAELSSRVGLDN